jgi:dTDP-4-dehydrorhamnose 3,5-epimerase-like enzyme
MEANESYVTTSTIPGLVLIERPTFSDDRGFFHEVERRGVDVDRVLHSPVMHRQWNHARSIRGVLRGIHVAQ